MGNSKIVYYGETLIDLTGDTVEAAKLLKGVTAHDKKGEKITGTFEAADPYAIIGVTYPEGSVCTCTNGILTLTAKDTSGKALFVIPSAGTWTVKAVKGSQSKSATVEITAEGQVETLVLAYELILFDGGDNTGVTGGWTYTITNRGYAGPPAREDKLTVGTTLYWLPGRTWNTEGTDQKNRNGYAHTKNEIDVTNYSTITAVSNYAQGHLTVGNASVALKVGTVSLDISALTGSYEVRLGDTVSGDACSIVEISKLSLAP